jgi:ABC-type sugar transport system ATPase subunit
VSFLEFKRLRKRFPGVQALDDVSFAVERVSCHAVIGENGAGKSTLGKILAGVYTPDEGEIWLEGVRIEPANPMAARRVGVAIVHQELAFCPNLSVAENLCLGSLPARAGWVNRREMQRVANRMLQTIEADIDPDLLMDQLSTGQEQMVQIAAAVGMDARVIVMDEPTSSLSLHESEHLFRLLGQLRRREVTVLYISHRMEEIFQLCNHVSVLRDGRHIATEPIAHTSPNRVIQLMIGREVSHFEPHHVQQTLGPELLRVENLSSPGKFEKISFSLRRGEVLGFAGLVGSGRSEIAQAVFGADSAAKGRAYIRGKELTLGSVRGALRARIGLLPEDRKRQGLVLTMNCRENGSLAILPRISFGGFLQMKQEQALVGEYTQQLRVKAPSLEVSIAVLSGGNQQKIALLKWLVRQCELLIIDEPTRGIDVGAKAEIHQLLDELACQGIAIWLISSELPELINLSRRILVLRRGKLVGELQRQDFSQPSLMRLMAGVEP